MKKNTGKKETTPKADANISNQANVKELEGLKESINKRYEHIEQEFYQLGLDLLKVNLFVKNFRKWVKENTEMSVSMAYTLMRLVKRDTELKSNKKFQQVKPKISLYKLIKLLKYPADFSDKLDFEKLYDVPGGQKFNLFDMPREIFCEVIDHEFRMLTAKERGESTDELDGIPLDEVIITKAKDKLGKMLSELENLVTVLAEVKMPESKEGSDSAKKAIEELESINSQATHINNVCGQLLGSLKKAASKAA